MEDYEERFSELYDQLTAYEAQPNMVHYVTRFMEGLSPSVRLLVGIQQPDDLDSAYDLALLSEELGDNVLQQQYSSSGSRRLQVQTVPKQSVSKTADEKKTTEQPRSDDRWAALRAYRKSKGLCFICGERWACEHRCKQEVQLHVVQEMLDNVQSKPAEFSDTEETVTDEVNAICISATAMGDVAAPATTTMQLKVQLQGHLLVFFCGFWQHSLLCRWYSGCNSCRSLFNTCQHGKSS